MSGAGAGAGAGSGAGATEPHIGAAPPKDDPAVGLPADVLMMERMLRSMGASEWDPAVVRQLIEVYHCQCEKVLKKAELLSKHRKSPRIEAADIKVAVDNRLAQPYPVQDILRFSREYNTKFEVHLNRGDGVGLRLPQSKPR